MFRWICDAKMGVGRYQVWGIQEGANNANKRRSLQCTDPRPDGTVQIRIDVRTVFTRGDPTMVIHAVYENGVFRPMEPVELPDTCQVKLIVSEEPLAKSQSVTTAPLAKLAAIASQHAENPNLPTDLARQHDHYLYGSPKRS